VTPASQGVPETVLAAEKPTAYEIGLKGALVDGRLGFDANVFYTKVETSRAALPYHFHWCAELPSGVDTVDHHQGI
jgi:outer membrane receptor for ferric coprogen and ferric-rhodotorulic acid